MATKKETNKPDSVKKFTSLVEEIEKDSLEKVEETRRDVIKDSKRIENVVEMANKKEKVMQSLEEAEALTITLYMSHLETIKSEIKYLNEAQARKADQISAEIRILRMKYNIPDEWQFDFETKIFKAAPKR